MSTGDINDLITRLKAIIPPWFSDDSNPILDGLLNAYANVGSAMYAQYSNAVLQTRIKTATGQFLDLISQDFFGLTPPISLPRGSGESDLSYVKRILDNLLNEKATRRGITNVLTNLTGRAPRLFEMRRPGDTGGYSSGGAGYCVAGGWGNPLCPFQGLVDAYRPIAPGIPGINGYNGGASGYSSLVTPQGYSAYASLSEAVNPVTDQQIYDAVNATKVFGTTVWVRISN